MDIEVKSGDTHGAPRPSRLPPTTALEASRLRDTLDTTLLLDSTTPLPRQHTPTTEHVAKGYATPFHLRPRRLQRDRASAPGAIGHPGLHCTHAVLTALISRNPTGPVILRLVQILDRMSCLPRGRARPLSPLRQISTSKLWSRATRTFLTSTGYHAT